MPFDLTTAQILGFLLAAVLVTLAPGPDNLSVLGLGMARGRRAGIGFGLGCALGCFTHTLWASLGISAAAVSKAVRQLEGRLGGKVFERNVTGMVPTSRGKPLLEGGREALRSLSAVTCV